MFARCTKSNGIRSLARFYSEGGNQSSSPSRSVPPQGSKVNVPGLSSAVIHPATSPVGPDVDPNKSGAYKVPEYFCYDNMSFFEAEIEMSKFRMPQPSALKKFLKGWTLLKYVTQKGLFLNEGS